MNESLLRAAFEPARELQPTEAEVAAALRVRPRRRRWPALLATGLVLAAGGTAVAVEGGLLSGLGGRPVTEVDHAPAWIDAPDTRVLAEAGGEQLYLLRRGDQIEFGLGASVGLGGDVESWRERFADTPLVVLGPGKRPRADGTRVLFGLTTRTIVRVELRYLSGPPTTASSATGGFALLADAARRQEQLIGYDARGAVVARIAMGGTDLRVCPDVRGCPPGRMQPERRPG